MQVWEKSYLGKGKSKAKIVYWNMLGIFQEQQEAIGAGTSERGQEGPDHVVPQGLGKDIAIV